MDPRVVDRVRRFLPLSFVVLVAAGVEIAIKARKVTTRDFETDAMARSEVIAGRLKIDFELVNFSRLHPHFLIKAFAITRAQDALLYVEGRTIGINVDEFSCKVRVRR